MLKYSIISDCITLLYRETLIKDKSSTVSHDIVNKLLELSKDDKRKATLGGDSSYLDEMISLIKDMLENPENFDKTTLLDKLLLIHNDRMDKYRTLESIINKDLTEDEIRKSIISLQKNIRNYITKFGLRVVISGGYKDLVVKDPDPKQAQLVALNLIEALKQLSTVCETTDPAIVDELDIEKSGEIANVTKKIKDKNQMLGILKTGWGVLNRILQGGFRRGEMWMINALQHNYKSGMLQSLVAQLARYNTPVMTDPKKKPLIVYFSFEDNSDIFIEFIYKYLYTNNNNAQPPNMSKVTHEEIAEYLKKELQQTGYNVKLIRADPTQWTYMDLFNKINSYESEGYEIHCCIVDYLAKLPTTGCINTGPGGTDVRDMFQRCRSFFSVKNICFITAHQLSTEAKQLIRNGIKESEFVKFLQGKGYTELSKQLDQIVDGELYIHIATINHKKFLTIQRGKHRIPGIIQDEDKYGRIPFLPYIPLQDNLNDEREADGEDNDLSELLNL